MEAAIVAQDIQDGHLTAMHQLDPATSCYECLVLAGGIDDDRFVLDHGLECGDLAWDAPTLDAGNPVQACLDTVECFIANGVVTSNVSPFYPAYCGAASLVVCESGGASGPCIAQENNGLDSSNLSGVVQYFFDATRPSGTVNVLAQFAYQNCKTQCDPRL
jgi:hypothetical protein